MYNIFLNINFIIDYNIIFEYNDNDKEIWNDRQAKVEIKFLLSSLLYLIDVPLWKWNKYTWKTIVSVFILRNLIDFYKIKLCNYYIFVQCLGLL